MKNISRNDKMVLFLLLFLLISVVIGVIANKFPKTLFNRAAGPNPYRWTPRAPKKASTPEPIQKSNSGNGKGGDYKPI